MDVSQETLSLSDEDLPEIYCTADIGAISSQQSHFFFVRFELICIALASVSEVFGNQIAPTVVNLLHLYIGSVDFLGRHYPAAEATSLLASNVIAGIFMALAILMFLLRFSLHRDHRWHGRRALAEATKGLAWRYSMHAMHADLHAQTPLSQEAARQAFMKELGHIEQQGYDLRLPAPKKDDVQLTAKMEKLRAASPVIQREAYLEERLKSQQDWYANKAAHYERWTTGLQWARGITYAVGVGMLIYNPFGPNGLSAMTTIAGAFATWLASRHYDDLSQNFGAMARKLIGLNSVAPDLAEADQAGASQQTTWSMFANEVETLLDGEHQDWLRNTR
jgi:hypothetical protein